MYKSKIDYVEINGLIYSNVFAGDFAPARTGDAVIREMDSNGSYQDYENPDNSGSVPVTIRSDAKNFLKEFRRLFENRESFTMTRNNRNKGGAKEIYRNCVIMNDGSSTRGNDGKLGNRVWTISYESYEVNEGVN